MDSRALSLVNCSIVIVVCNSIIAVVANWNFVDILADYFLPTNHFTSHSQLQNDDFRQKKKFENCGITCWILRSKKAYSLKYYLSKAIFLYVLYLLWMILYKYKVKQIIELAKTFRLFAWKTCQRNSFVQR